MSNWDLIIGFKYDINKGEPLDLETNVKPEHIGEVLSDYLRSHMGAGRDKSTPDKKDIYHVRIGLDLSDDSFGTYSDTGNKGLTDGIVMKSVGKLEVLAKNKANLSAQEELERDLAEEKAYRERSKRDFRGLVRKGLDSVHKNAQKLDDFSYK